MSSQNLKRVFVFIASPGDVSDSRGSIRHAVERINKLLAKESGFFLEPIGWEDIPPGKSERSQQIINPYVDKASIFIGVLHKRFGHPTGVAESGTKEEYNRIEQRWESEDPKPEVLIYFKEIPNDELTDPGEQLQKVLNFKTRISDTCLYREFENKQELTESIQDALHDWILKNQGKYEVPADISGIITLQPTDKEVLVCLLEKGQASIDDICFHLEWTEVESRASIERLLALELIAEGTQNNLMLINSTDGFLAIVRYINTDAHYKILLSSNYFQEMLSSLLRNHIRNRFHCEIPAEMIDALQCIAILSSSATNYLLFGDTSIYDNLFENTRIGDVDAKELANKLMLDRIILCALLEFGTDYTKGRVLTELRSKRLAGLLLNMNLKAAYENAKAFEIQIGMPVIGAYASDNFRAGELGYASPEFFIRQGTILMHLDLHDFAEEAFDKALSGEISDAAKAMALNNKGLTLLNRNCIPEAISTFKEASKIDSTLDEPKKNLEIAIARLENN